MFRSIAFRAGVITKRQIRQYTATSVESNTVNSSEVKRKSSRYSLIISSFVVGGITAYLFPLSSLAQFAISEKLPAPETPEAEAYKIRLEKKLHELDIYKRLESNQEYESVRAWNYVDSNTLNHTLTAGTLSVPGGIAIKPVLFYNKATKESVTIVHVGDKLSGYPFLIHGGMLATILDETLKRASSFQFGIDPINEYTPQKIKTKNIELQYKFPTLANNFIIVKTKILDNGKVSGNIETVKGRLLVKGLGEFEPRANSIISPKSTTTKTKWFFGLF